MRNVRDPLKRDRIRFRLIRPSATARAFRYEAAAASIFRRRQLRPRTSPQVAPVDHATLISHTKRAAEPRTGAPPPRAPPSVRTSNPVSACTSHYDGCVFDTPFGNIANFSYTNFFTMARRCVFAFTSLDFSTMSL